MRKRTVLATLAAATLLVVLVTLTGSLSRRQGRPPAPRPDTGSEATRREEAAQALFGRAQLAADRGDWRVVQHALELLRSDFADTRFLAANRVRIAGMLRQAEDALAAPPANAGTTTVPAPPRPRLTLAEALAEWPAVLADALDSPSCLKKALLLKGQYGGHFEVKGALKVSGSHTISAAWWDQAVGGAFLLSVDVRAVSNARPWIWLCGSGTGTGHAQGYRLRLLMDAPDEALELERQGRVLGPAPPPVPLRWGQWYRLDILRQDERLLLHLDGRLVTAWHDPAPLRGPTHSFIGLGSHLGLFGKSGSWYRNLAVRMPAEEAQRLEERRPRRILDPPLTVLPLPNGRLIAEDEFARDGLDRWAGTRPSWGVHKRREGLVLSGPNCWPRPWRKEPVAGHFAVELPMHYFPKGEAVNFSVRLRLGEFVNAPDHKFTGWSVHFPAGDGMVHILWHDEQGHAASVASSAYFAPVPGRPYRLRIERVGHRLRVFANGGYLLEAGAPAQVPLDTPVFIGLRQIYGGSVVERMTVWEIPGEAPPGLLPLMPGHGADYGPTLAATADLEAALDGEVRPLLAGRRYVDAQVALTQLSVQPRFRQASFAMAQAEGDVDRLLRFWAVARPWAERSPGQDVLSVLPPSFLDDPEARLQAALFLLVDGQGAPGRAMSLLEALDDGTEARRYRVLAARGLEWRAPDPP